MCISTISSKRGNIFGGTHRSVAPQIARSHRPLHLHSNIPIALQGQPIHLRRPWQAAADPKNNPGGSIHPHHSVEGDVIDAILNNKKGTT